MAAVVIVVGFVVVVVDVGFEVEVGIDAVVVDVGVVVEVVEVVVVDEAQDAKTSDVTMRQVNTIQITLFFIWTSFYLGQTFDSTIKYQLSSTPNLIRLIIYITNDNDQLVIAASLLTNGFYLVYYCL